MLLCGSPLGIQSSPEFLFGTIDEAAHLGWVDAWIGSSGASCSDLDGPSAEVCAMLTGQHLDAALDVERRRHAHWKAGTGPDPNESQQAQWRELADRVKRLWCARWLRLGNQRALRSACFGWPPRRLRPPRPRARAKGELPAPSILKGN